MRRALAWIRLSVFWVRSRFAEPNRFVACRTCPHWLRHSQVDYRLPQPKLAFMDIAALQFVAGLCLKDKPRIFADYTTGYALRVWTGEDWCPRHPLYESKIVQGSDLEFLPGEQTTQASAGFSRHPTFAEAVRMAGVGRDTLKAPDKVDGDVPLNGTK
jgi:hypothetical protein